MEHILDIKDKRIIEQLEVNSRQSIRQLSRKVGLSKDATIYRIKKMEDLGIISGYYSVIDIAKLGLMQFKVFITFQNTNSKIEEEIIQYLIKDENVGWVVSCDGYYNLMAVYWCKNPIAFDTLFTEFLNKYSCYIKQREIAVIPEEFSLRHSFLYSNNKIPLSSFYGGEPTFNVDQKDIIIIEALANNSKESLHGIAEKINLTSEAVAKRIKNLQEKGVFLAFRPKLNLNTLNYSFYSLLFKLKKINKIQAFYEYFKVNPNATYISKYLGAYDLGIDIQVKNADELRDLIAKFKNHFKDDIESYISILIHKEHKLSYFPQKLAKEKKSK